MNRLNEMNKNGLIFSFSLDFTTHPHLQKVFVELYFTPSGVYNPMKYIINTYFTQ